LREQDPYESSTDQPSYRGTKSTLAAAVMHDIVREKRKLWVEKQEHDNGRCTVDDGGKIAARDAETRFECAGIEGGKNSDGP
jgi:hypothetical protein